MLVHARSYGAAVAIVRALVVTATLALLASACSSGTPTGALSAADYSARLAEIFESEDTPEADFPVGGSSVQVAGTFMVIEEGVTAFRSLVPPPELEGIHTELVERFDAVQEAVADYLQHHGVEGGEITMTDIVLDTEISPRLMAAQEKCQELRLQLFELDAPLPDRWCLV